MQITSVSHSSVPAKTDRGGSMHVLLSPRTVETKTGFMGTLVLSPAEIYQKHYHPYSDEYLYIVSGEVTITGASSPIVAQADTGVFISKDAPHRLQNTGTEDALIVFFACPLAPRPDLGHVTLED